MPSQIFHIFLVPVINVNLGFFFLPKISKGRTEPKLTVWIGVILWTEIVTFIKYPKCVRVVYVDRPTRTPIYHISIALKLYNNYLLSNLVSNFYFILILNLFLLAHIIDDDDFHSKILLDCFIIRKKYLIVFFVFNICCLFKRENCIAYQNLLIQLQECHFWTFCTILKSKNSLNVLH